MLVGHVQFFCHFGMQRERERICVRNHTQTHTTFFFSVTLGYCPGPGSMEVVGSSDFPVGHPNLSRPLIEKAKVSPTLLFSGYWPGPGPPASGSAVTRAALCYNRYICYLIKVKHTTEHKSVLEKKRKTHTHTHTHTQRIHI
jgi:hypothetical protein